MTDEQYQNLQEDYINHILEYVKESGNLFPHISVFADIIKPKNESEKDKPALIHIPIDDEYMKDDESKDRFVDGILPDVFKDLKEKFAPKAIGWAAEAWMRVIDKKNFNPEKDNWKAIPVRKEVIMINIETENKQECFLYEIKRLGKQVNSDGEMTDIIELNKLDDLSNHESMAGRFSGLFQKFNK
jgi:hypothetical protein